MRRAGSALAAALACAALLGTGCAGAPGPTRPQTASEGSSAKSRLPEYAKPRAEVRDFATQPPPDGIPYRTLTRDDFRGAAAPAYVAAYQDRMGAYTCANLVPARGVRVRVRQDAAAAPFVAELVQVGFEAQMDPECSWWNSKQVEIPPEHVLQHEQVHFAITEIEARELLGRTRTLAASGATPAEAQASLQRSLDAELARTRDRIVERNLAFDEDTSLRYAPEAQQRWFERVQEELARGK